MTLSRSGRGVSWRQLVDINIPQGRTPLEPPRTSARPPLPRPSPNAPGTQRSPPAGDADLAEVWERPNGYEYEKEVRSFVVGLTAPARGASQLSDLAAARRSLAHLGVATWCPSASARK